MFLVSIEGVDEFNNATLPSKEALVDNFRIVYYKPHLSFPQEAIE